MDTKKITKFLIITFASSWIVQLIGILSKNGYVSQISNFLGQKVEIPRDKSVSCSIGVAVSKNVRSDEELSELIKNADSSLYSVKHTTKNAVKFFEA